MKQLAVMFALTFLLAPARSSAQETALESMSWKTVLVFTPHPDDELFGAGGTIALLNQHHNKVYIVIYTNDDKGSYAYYTMPQKANYWINIDSVAKLKLEAATKHVSQFEPSIQNYRNDWEPSDLAKVEKELMSQQPKKDGHYVEAFRRAASFNEMWPEVCQRGNA